MANISGKFIKGQVANLVYRDYRGKQIVQGKPHVRKSHLTEGTKKAADIFGKSSRLAAGLRRALAYVCFKLYDGTMIYRLNAEILRCLNSVKDPETGELNFAADSFQTLAGFEFNVNSMVKNNFFVQPKITIDGLVLKVTIPELKIPLELKSPIERLNECRLIIAVAMVDLTHSHSDLEEPQLMVIPYSFKPTLVPEQTFEFPILPGCLCVTAISLKYVEKHFAGESILNNKSFNPAAILHATIAEGTVDPAMTKNWHKFN
ncbi:hypothetical protein [Pedobacter insulae]|uniref:Uncharacterized protein n=1 Tax=Pedobacter insulae TaxID=414048 RepID=A0A1I2YHV2_9SPHI|nr:hypothetical protein [Pedobacter insulae]SFH25184.1 hypothetical protein SAMN04489864_107107 [Pedobacter insulae]